MTDSFVKRSPAAPTGYFAWEAAGLRWLSDAESAGGAPIVDVLGVTEDSLLLERLQPASPSGPAAAELGRRLARTHLAGAAAYGCGPEGWVGDGFFGPLAEPLPMPLGSWSSWGAFFAEARVAPLVRTARDRGVYDATEVGAFDRVTDRLADGDMDTADPPARIHGDLWAGNVVWTAGGAVLVDPAAHGGHRENDLALLALFGAPHLSEVLRGYQEVSPLGDGWRERQGIHQLHCLLVHAVVFGGGYARQAMKVTRRWH